MLLPTSAAEDIMSNGGLTEEAKREGRREGGKKREGGKRSERKGVRRRQAESPSLAFRRDRMYPQVFSLLFVLLLCSSFVPRRDLL